MVELNDKIRICAFILSMVLSVHCLEISILDVLSDFKCKTKIITKKLANVKELYVKTALKPYYYETYYRNSTVIAYIVDETRFEEIVNPDALEIRMAIGQELARNNHELIVLGINNCQDHEIVLISNFLNDITKYQPNQIPYEIVTIGEGSFNRTYSIIPSNPFRNYKEKSQIYNGTFQEHLRRSFPKMAYRSKRPDSSKIKEVRFFEYFIGRRHYPTETTWPIYVENGQYVPASKINFNRMEDNFTKRYKNVNVHILIVSGKDYIQLTTDNQNSVPSVKDVRKIMDKMSKNNEILFIMGCFNFDWSEIGIVSQIILKHSEIEANGTYNVFTAGIGMFDTIFYNPNKDDKRKLRPSSNNEVMTYVEKCYGKTMRTKTIDIFNLNALTVTTNQIVLSNGRYEIVNDYIKSQYPNARFAFIVINSTEMNDQHVFSVAQTNPYVSMLQSNSIELFVIKLNNFRLYDLHIIPEWIESNRGTVPRNRIAILGGGSCDTTFQFVSPEYQITYAQLNVANELKEIRNAIVTIAGCNNDKSIILGNINVPDFRVQKFSMHTINGFYDPVVLSENDMTSTVGNIKILFLIMNADKLTNMIKAVPVLQPTLVTDFRQRIANHFPLSQWAVYLVGLDNFGEKDFHLFAEFVESFTNDRRLPREFMYTFGDEICQSMYEYKDTLPFITTENMPIAGAFTEFFQTIDIIVTLNED